MLLIWPLPLPLGWTVGLLGFLSLSSLGLWVQTKLLPHILAFPLSIHALSMYTFISWCLSLVQSSMMHCTGLAVDFLGSVNTQKHSLMLSLLVRVGSKVTVLPSSLALLFCSFLRWVKDSLVSCGSLCSGFSLRIVR